MKHSCRFCFLFLFLASVCLSWANLEISITDVESNGNSGIVHMKLKNSFEQGVRSARIWVFMLDDEGKVVGNQAQWLFNGEGEKSSLEVEEERDSTVMVESENPFSTAKATFSRIIMEDGTIERIE